MTTAQSVPALRGVEALRIPFLDLDAMHAPIAEALSAAWQDTLARSGFIGGRAVERFEQEWAAYCGVDHAVGTANGTDALVLALRALGIGRGDEVILPSNTFIATAAAVVLAGASPRFVDVDPATLLVTPQHVDAAVTPRTAAVIVVHLFGSVPDMQGLSSVVRRHRLALIEDAAQAHGAAWHGRRAGSFGDIATFSFYPGKNLGALGDGGAVVTSSADLAGRVRALANHGRRAGAQHYHHELLGTNSRLDGLQAAFLSVKLAYLSDWNAARRAAAARYRALLRECEVGWVTEPAGSEGVNHLMVVRVDERDRVRQRLAERGIGTGIHYPVPCHLHPPMVEYAWERLPVVESAAEELLSLPMFPNLTEDQIRAVCTALGEEVAPWRSMSPTA